jgi:dolichol-phosphate mannosyltransferase
VSEPAFLRRVADWRFLKFGLVGASGIPVNLAILYLGQDWLFPASPRRSCGLNVSLALAIFCATINNFTWNRVWTWRDRQAQLRTPMLVQFAQYALASWLGIALQLTFTNLLVVHFHYLVANTIAIVLASVFNFLANDLWTFGRAKPWLQRRD